MLQHRQALAPSPSSASSDATLASQASGVKFGRAARVGALGVAAGFPQASVKGNVLSASSRCHLSPWVCVLPIISY